MALPIAAGGLPSLRPAAPSPRSATKRANPFWMKRAQGTPAIEGADTPYEGWLCQCFYPLPVPHKKRTSYKRFVNASGVRFKKSHLPLFGAMLLDEERGRHGPVRGALPWKGLTPLTKIGFANTSIPSQFLTKNEPLIRDSLTLPEFVSKNPTFPDLA